MPIAGEGSLKELMDQVVILENQVVAEHPELIVYRWHPVGLPDLPAIWNWLGDSPFDMKDSARGRDVIDLRIRLGNPPDAVEEAMSKFELWADTLRDIIDKALWTQPILGGKASAAHRRGMNTTTVRFGQTEVLAFEFQLEIWLDRRLR